MASKAYQPDQTQTPYRGWGEVIGFRALQSDAAVMYLDSALRASLAGEDDAERQHIHIGDGPEREEFKAHYAQWLEDSLFDSLPDQMRRHESYQAIVELGDRVVPLIASELRRSPSYIFLALEEIVGQDPVPEDAEGNLDATVSAWLSWLRK